MLIPYLILFAAGLLAIEGPVHRWHEQRIVQGETEQINGVWNVFPVFLASIYGGYFGGGLSVIVLAVLSLVSLESLTSSETSDRTVCERCRRNFFLFSGKVRWSATIVMAIGALIGGGIGGLAPDRVRPVVLRWIVVVFGWESPSLISFDRKRRDE